MKVVQINTFASGSTGKLATAIHKQLLKNGVESYFFFGYGSLQEKNTYRFGNMFDAHVHSVLSRTFGLQGYFSHFTTWQMLKKVKAISPDVVHLHNIHGSFLNWPMLFRYLKKSNVKVIVTLHDCCLFTGKCPHFTRVNCDKWKNECGNCPQLKRYPKSNWLDFTKKIINDKKRWFSALKDVKIVTVSKWLKDMAEKSLLKQFPVQCIYNGINTETFSIQQNNDVLKKYNIDAKFVILGVASEWGYNKGFGYFKEIAQKLEQDTKIVLVGKSDDIKNELTDNMIVIDRTENQQELACLYSAADVFVNMSVEETFGLVVAEAMACGTPAIVFDSTACPEVVKEGTGFIAPPGDTDKVVEYINTIRADGKDKYSAACREHVLKNYTFERMLKEYMELYNGINT